MTAARYTPEQRARFVERAKRTERAARQQDVAGRLRDLVGRRASAGTSAASRQAWRAEFEELRDLLGGER
jgi:hypothetical protein